MHIGDVLALAPTVVATDSALHPFTTLAADYYSAIGIKSLPKPQVCVRMYAR
jgi:hypothetical protein